MSAYSDKIGCYIQIPNLGRGQLKYVGPVESKPGVFAGVDLLANIGKNDGSFQGRRYFQAEYSQSGLFIQLQKIEHLLENATTESRRESLGNTTFNLDKYNAHEDDNLMSDGVHMSENRVSSNGSTIIRKPLEQNEVHSPTPIRSFRITSRNNNRTPTQGERMDIDSRASDSQTESIIKDYELRIEKQEREILQYRKLLEDQRIVLEEIQPTIDEYENNERRLRSRVQELETELDKQREKFKSQKEFFEAEHEQLLAVVSQLQVAIEENEQKAISRKESLREDTTEITKTIQDLTDEHERARAKWEKEKMQLKMHNDSLSQEYQSLNKELMNMQGQKSNPPTDELNSELTELRTRVRTLESQLQEKSSADTNIQSSAQASQSPSQPESSGSSSSLPVYKPPVKVDPAAGRELWCYLCEKPGHRTTDCPHELKSTNDEFF